MPYSIETNNNACANGYAVVKDADGTLIFCHKTRREAVAQIAALNINENYRALPDNYRPASSDNVPAGRRCGNCSYFANNYCSLWDAKVMASYYCNKWQGSAEDRADKIVRDQAGENTWTANSLRVLLDLRHLFLFFRAPRHVRHPQRNEQDNSTQKPTLLKKDKNLWTVF